MPIPDLPPSRHQQERIVCSITAAEKYHIPASILLAIAEKEGGKPGLWVKNTNGTHDVGTMQFNTAYLKTLEKYGITPGVVAGAGCYSYDLAAWRIRGHLTKDRGDLWTRAANYHSRTPSHNLLYRADLKVRANRWANWLEQFMIPHAAAINVNTLLPEAKPLSQPDNIAHRQPVQTTYVPRTIAVSRNE